MDYEKFLKSFIAFDISKNDTTILSNYMACHGVRIAVNILFNAFLFPKNSSITTSLNFKYQNDKSFKRQKNYDCQDKFASSIPFRFWLEILMFILLLIEEKKSNLKTFQLMLVNPVIYWLSHFIFDFPIFFIYAIISFVLGGVVNPELKDFLIDNLGTILVELVLHIIGMLFIGYVLTLFSKEFLHAMLYYLIFVVLGEVGELVYGHYRKPKQLRYITPINVWVVSIKKLCFEKESDYIKTMLIYIAVSFAILCLVDCRIVPKIWHRFWTACCCQRSFPQLYPKDETVKTEEALVEDLKKSRQLSQKILVVDQLKRWYCSVVCHKCCRCAKQAVKGVSFTTDKQECFGLLGVNGAGKSSIFNVLTGNLTPTWGSAYVKSHSVIYCCMRHKNGFFNMGFCSQSGNFLLNFKGREMLQLFGRLRGLKGKRLKKAVDKSVAEILLQNHEKKKCNTYSGGTLRKLAVAMSMIGDPAIALLDEPTTSIDPAARRAIWDIISGYRENGHSVLLSSHSMDECEALCTRLGIMTTGQLRCVGEITTLKSIFGQNYTVSVKTSPTAKEEDRAKVKDAMMNSFKDGCQVMDEHLTVVQYQITKESATWKKLFSELNTIKAKFPILESFSASSTTLEQLFIHFTKD